MSPRLSVMPAHRPRPIKKSALPTILESEGAPFLKDPPLQPGKAGQIGYYAMLMYQEHLGTMCHWFDQWNESGQTVALIQMLTKVSPTQARFITIALENSLTECSELAMREQEANNQAYISNLLNEAKEKAMEELLLHLPLLRPGNKEAKHSYIGVISALLNYCVENSQLLDIAMQLLVYITIHPALKEDRQTFELWRKKLAEKMISIGGGAHPCAVESADARQCRIRRSNSLTPPYAFTQSNELSNSQDDLSVRQSSSRRFSLSLCEAAPLSPQSSAASSGSGSESQLDDLRPGYDNPGMRDVRSWLKSLRLHKYSRFFSLLTYTQMLNLTEDTFESTVESVGAGPVTVGAQRKILLSITKLRERYQNLCQLEQEITESSGENLLSAMDKVKACLLTPLKAYDETDQLDNLPHQIVKVLYKVCTLLRVCGVVDEEALTSFISLLDNALRLEAFTSEQKSKMDSWRQQIVQHLSTIRRMQQQQYGFLSVPPARFLQPVSRPLPTLPLRHLHTHTQSFMAKRPSLQDNPSEPYGGGEQTGHSSVQRTHSAPPNPPQDPQDGDPELNSRLESLCLRMTEQSLEL